MNDENRISLCPLCGNGNRCGVASPGGCWCGQVEIPMELIELLPEIGKSCICRECVMVYQEDPAGFRRVIRTRPA